MRHNLTTPGGFFVGLGGIAAICVMTAGVYWWVKSAAVNTELRPQQAALGLAAKPEETGDAAKTVAAKTDALLKSAAAAYNDGRMPDLDNLAELRGVVRYRAAKESDQKAAEALNAPSSVPGKTIIQAAMEAVAAEIKAKPVSKSAVALMEVVAADPTAAPTLPNVTGGGAKTQQFADPNAKPAATPAPAPQPVPAIPATPTPAAPTPAAPVPAVAPPPAAPAPAPARPPLINSSEPQK
jgi:hypothetical protein